MHSNSEQFVEFQEIIGKLKHLRRTGWVMRNVPCAETVASHSWRMALMAIQKESELSALNVDTNKVIEMCLLHDVSEVIVGDIVPEEHQVTNKKISKAEKKELEINAIRTLSEKYNFPKLQNLFEEYEEQKTPEAVIVKNLDKLDMLLQAYEYLQQYPEIQKLNEFMEYNEKDITLPIFKEELAEIKSRQYFANVTKNDFIDFQLLAGKLKHLERSGPKMYEIKDCETVASHCFRTAIMALFLEKELTKVNIDTSKVVRYALVHDMGEAIIGDIVPEKWQKGNRISKEEKHKREVEAILKISKDFNMPFIWQSFDDIEQRKTIESSLAKDLEIFESIQQAYEYIKIYPEKAILREYIPFHKPRIKAPFIQDIIKEVEVKQNKFLTSRNFPTFYKEGGR